MKNGMKVLVILSLCIMVMLAMTACGRPSASGGSAAGTGGEYTAENPLIFKYAHTDSEEHSCHKAGEHLAEYLEKASDGRIKVELYPNGVLGDDEECIKGVQMGTVTAFVGGGTLPTVAGPEFGFTEMPFVYNSYEDWVIGSFEKGGLEVLQDALKDTEFECVDFMYSGTKCICSTKQNYESIDQFKGWKIRVTPTDINLAIWKANGANPTPVAWGEVYTGLTQGLIEGVDHTMGNFIDMKFYEEAPYVTVTNHLISPYTFLMNKEYLASLPDDLREIIIEGIHETCEWQRELEHEKEEGYVPAQGTK